MTWSVIYTENSIRDYQKLDGSQRIAVDKVIRRVSLNPLPINDGGYGKPLGNKNNNYLTGFLKIKLKRLGIRIVYGLKRVDSQMKIIVIGLRSDDEVYLEATKRIKEGDFEK